ncbi:MAG TPA: Ig-like domain-containing protein [Verrucomicrobiae bacterium]
MLTRLLRTLVALTCIFSASAQTSFVIEAEDINFDGGQYLPDANTMPYYGGAYEGYSAVHGVDYFRGMDTFEGDIYRYGEFPNLPLMNDTNPLAVERGEWTVTSNYRIGWNLPETWYNYTRVFPAGDYRVYAGLTHGDTAPDMMRGKLSLVLSGSTTTEQSLLELGNFRAAGSGSWNNVTPVPLRVDGETAVVSLAGEMTVRFTSDSGDFDYLMFVPAAAPEPSVSVQDTTVVAGQPLLLTATTSGEGPFSYQWRHNGTPIDGATSAIYEVASATASDAGTYNVFVSNAAGGMLSPGVRIEIVIPLQIGDTASGALTGGGVFEEIVYTFNGSAGTAIFLEGLSGDACNSVYISVRRPDSLALIGPTALGSCFDGPLQPSASILLPVTGRYTIVVTSFGFASFPDYSFRISNVPFVTQRNILLNETVDGFSSDLATGDAYLLHLSEPTSVAVEEIAGTACYGFGQQWALVDVNGNVVATEALGPECDWPIGLRYDLAAGDYQLLIVPGSIQDFYSLRITPVVVQTHTIEIGATVLPNSETGAGILEGPGATDSYQFQATAGQWLYLGDVFVPERAYVDLQLTSPSGTALPGVYVGVAPILLPETGTYTLSVFSYSGAYGNYGFKLLPSAGVQTFAYTLETLIGSSSAPAGFLDGNGSVDEFTFTIDGPPGGLGKFVDFVDHGSAGNQMFWTLEQLSPGFPMHIFTDLLDGISPGINYLYPGEYRIRIYAANGDPNIAGSYSFATDISYPPVAVGENYRTKMDKPLRIPKGRLLSNDYDPDGTPVLWFEHAWDPFLSNGSVEDKGDTLLFTPNPGFRGEAYFWYSVQDSVQWWMTTWTVVTIQVE